MKKQTMKRIFTVILAVCMLLSIAPVTMAADTADGGYQKGDIIEFGSYPQSKVTNPRIISALDGFLTDKVPELYEKAYGADIYATLPELFWDLPESKPSVHRYRYHDFISELFSSSFADNIGSWCRKNGIALTGHMMEEPTLRSQCAALGEAMRSYRGFDIPGSDMLCNWHEFTTAKQAQSAVHQFGYDYVGDTRNVDSHVARLRGKLGVWGSNHLKTIYGIGYKIEVN